MSHFIMLLIFRLTSTYLTLHRLFPSKRVHFRHQLKCMCGATSFIPAGPV
uniref:Uncharacterized protein n=1 Tax=Anguilla anguilla TaxID=7936 RepID=A0A0E9SBR7_ANGAN